MACVQCVEDTIHRRASQICLWPDVPFVIGKYAEDISQPRPPIIHMLVVSDYDAKIDIITYLQKSMLCRILDWISMVVLLRYAK